MLDPNKNYKCCECDRKARKQYLGKFYCKKHYILKVFECDNISVYISKNKISHMHSAIDNHIIINNRNRQIIELGTLLNVEFWFGKGMVGNTDLADSMHINTS